MVKRKARNTATDPRTAKKFLVHYEAEVLAAVKELRSARRALMSLGKKLAEESVEGDHLTVVQEVLAGSRPFDASFVDSITVLSRRRMQPLEHILEAKQAELSQVVAEKEQWKEIQKTIREKIMGERKATRDKASARLKDLESAVVLGGELLRRAQGRLRPLEQDVVRRERGLLRWSQKTENIRAKVEELRREALKHETSIRQSEEQLDEARKALADARARLLPEIDHPELVESIEKLSELSAKERGLKKSNNVLNRQVTAVRNDFVDKATNLERKFRSCVRSLWQAVRAVPSLRAPVDRSDPLWHPLDSDFDKWFAECKKRRQRAPALIGSQRHSTLSDDERVLRDQIIRELVAFGNQREQQREQARERRAQQARDRREQREHAARERERQEARRERQIVAANRRDYRRVVKRQQTAEAALREFERENRRLDARIEQNSAAHDSAESRVVRIIAQMRARNPYLTPEFIRANRLRFSSYDNARARVEDLERERQLLHRLFERRARLRRAKSEADERVAAELRSQSTSVRRDGGWAHHIEVNEWEDAERLAEKHMQRLGYSDARRTNAGADGGVDVESARAVAQVKDQSNPVGRHLIQQLYGVAHSRNKKAFFFARRYAPQAVEWARENNVKLYQFNRAGVVTEIL